MYIWKFGNAVLLLFLLSAASIHSLDLNGRVTAEGELPIADSTVVLLELDLIEVTDANGVFQFRDIADLEYTLLVIAPGFEEKEFSVSVQNQPITLSLAPEVIEMDVIVVKADSEEASDIIKEGVSSEELERQPPRSDPFKSIALESGILKELDIINFNMDSGERGGPGSFTGPVVIPEGRFSLSGRNEVSVYGGESDWNNYYFDYIRLPTNKHTFGFPEADAVVPREAVDSIRIYRGAYPVEYGPGIGGLFSLNPKVDIDSWALTLTPSIMDLAGITSFQITDNINMLLSLNQSILNYTVLPIISSLAEIESEEELVEGEIPTGISYGDFLLRFLFTPPGHNISVDFLGYYDRWTFDLSFEDATLNSVYGPYYLALGSKWLSSIGTKYGNTLYLFGSLYKDTGNFDFYLPSVETGFTTDYNLAWISNVNSLQAGDEFQWNITPDLTLLAGLNARISDLDGTYNDNNLVTENEIELEHLGYSNDILFDDLLLSTYGYTKIFGRLDDLEYHTGVGLLLYPETAILKPAVEGELIYSREFSSFALPAGWSPGVIDEFTYIDRRLDELYYELESETSVYQPPMAAAAAGQ
ncbi:MAG TPA: hypothetical protein DCO79_10710, partial [Spirochaeta sp.]|nr:hypothetical protein [Spirochaeta sp.]